MRQFFNIAYTKRVSASFCRVAALLLCLMIAVGFSWDGLAKSSKIPTWVKGRLSEHKDSYAPKPQRGPHLDIKVTPPEIRGKDGKLLIEVYNRSKEHIMLVTFDLKLFNNQGYELDSQVQAEDLRPNLSGGQWVKIPQIQEKFPKILGARASNIKIITADSREIALMPYLDVIKY